MILSVAYGIAIKESEDPYISTAEIAMNGLAEAGIPGRFWVDYMPLLKHVPSWVPGAGFQKKAAYWRRINEDMREKPFIHVKDQLVSAIFCFYFHYQSERLSRRKGQRHRRLRRL